MPQSRWCWNSSGSDTSLMFSSGRRIRSIWPLWRLPGVAPDFAPGTSVFGTLKHFIDDGFDGGVSFHGQQL